MKDLEKFKAELAELLGKYDATIFCHIEGEIQTNCEMKVDFGANDLWKEYHLVIGSSVGCKGGKLL